MSEIDWSKAPEGATHFYNSDWYKVSPFTVTAMYWSTAIKKSGEWREAALFCSARAIPRPSSPAWNGEGLPPVGTVCEVMNNTLDNPDWERCTILFMGKFKAVYESESCHERVADVSENWMISFRPIRTPEQIAAEERDKAVQAMMEISVTQSTDETICAALYDAGYRKTEG